MHKSLLSSSVLQIAAPAIRKALLPPPIKLISLDASDGSTRFGQLELGGCLGKVGSTASCRHFQFTETGPSPSTREVWSVAGLRQGGPMR